MKTLLERNPVMEFHKNITIKGSHSRWGHIRFHISVDNTEWIMTNKTKGYVNPNHKVVIHRGYDVDNPVRVTEVIKHFYFNPITRRTTTRFDMVIFEYTWDRDISKDMAKMHEQI